LRQSAAANAQAAAQSAPIQSRYRAHRRLPIAATFYDGVDRLARNPRFPQPRTSASSL